MLSCGQHLARDQTVRMVKWQGYWWPTLHEDATAYVRACVVCRAHDPHLHATLYHTMGIPKYAQHIYDYQTSSTINDQPNTKKRLIVLEAQWYRIIGKQIYRIGPDGNLDRKSTRLNSSHSGESRMPSSA